jgi:hypothetical protein
MGIPACHKMGHGEIFNTLDVISTGGWHFMPSLIKLECSIYVSQISISCGIYYFVKIKRKSKSLTKLFFFEEAKLTHPNLKFNQNIELK